MKEIFNHVDPVAVNWSDAAIEQIFKKVAMPAADHFDDSKLRYDMSEVMISL